MINKIVGTLITAVAIGVCAQLEIQLPESVSVAPITGQSLAVLVGAYLLGMPWGILAVLLYIAMGAAGLPLFSDFSGGIDVLLGPSRGYLIGFVLAAALCAFWAEKRPKGFGQYFLVFTLATLLILASGYVGLLPLLDSKQAFMKGVLPFLPGGLVKILLAAILISIISRFQGFINQDALRQS